MTQCLYANFLILLARILSLDDGIFKYQNGIEEIDAMFFDVMAAFLFVSFKHRSLYQQLLQQSIAAKSFQGAPSLGRYAYAARPRIASTVSRVRNT